MVKSRKVSWMPSAMLVLPGEGTTLTCPDCDCLRQEVSDKMRRDGFRGYLCSRFWMPIVCPKHLAEAKERYGTKSSDGEKKVSESEKA
jgi:NDP-sugar pyrophosphorylase family protein